MKPLEIIFQGLTRRHHVDVFGEICALDDLKKLLISVAFANSNGVSLVEDEIRPHTENTSAWIGVRNDITSIQGLSALLPLVDKLFVVDTAIRQRIFHPKVYLSYNETEARIAIGSANLTTGGLSQNIEASALIRLDLTDKDSFEAVKETDGLLSGLEARFSANVRRITRETELADMLAAGVIIDEALNTVPRPATSREVSERAADPVAQMPLWRGPLPQRSSAVAVVPAPSSSAPTAAPTKLTGATAPPAAPAPSSRATSSPTARAAAWEQVWKSGPLKRRDLNIPTAGGTNPTGSMLFKKGDWRQWLDQRHYFYDDVFNSLT